MNLLAAWHAAGHRATVFDQRGKNQLIAMAGFEDRDSPLRGALIDSMLGA